MKKVILALITVLLLLALCACGGGNEEQAESSTGADAEQFGGTLLEQLQQQPGESDGTEWVEADQDTPFGQYRSVDELRAIIEDGAEDENAIAPIQDETPITHSVSESESYSGSKVTSTFSEDGWEEPEVVFHNDWESMMEEEMAEEGYGDYELPEGYEDVLPEGFDMESFMDMLEQYGGE